MRCNRWREVAKTHQAVVDNQFRFGRNTHNEIPSNVGRPFHRKSSVRILLFIRHGASYSSVFFFSLFIFTSFHFILFFPLFALMRSCFISFVSFIQLDIVAVTMRLMPHATVTATFIVHIVSKPIQRKNGFVSSASIVITKQRTRSADDVEGRRNLLNEIKKTDCGKWRERNNIT